MNDWTTYRRWRINGQTSDAKFRSGYYDVGYVKLFTIAMPYAKLGSRLSFSTCLYIYVVSILIHIFLHLTHVGVLGGRCLHDWTRVWRTRHSISPDVFHHNFVDCIFMELYSTSGSDIRSKGDVLILVSHATASKFRKSLIYFYVASGFDRQRCTISCRFVDIYLFIRKNRNIWFAIFHPRSWRPGRWTRRDYTSIWTYGPSFLDPQIFFG